MKKIWMIVFTILLLSACNVRELTFEREYPDTSQVDAIREANVTEQQMSPAYQKYQYLITNPIDTPKFTLRSTKLENYFRISPHVSCFNDTIEFCQFLNADMLFNDPHVTYKMYEIEPRDWLTFETFDIEEIPNIASVEMELYRENKSRVDFGYTIDEHQYGFEAPREEGVYTFVARVLYNEGVYGVGLYTFKLKVVK